MTARYPSTKDLADFRRSLAPDPRGPVDYASWSPPFPAFEIERDRGIGFRVAPLPSPEWSEDPMASRHWMARGMAGRLRSREYGRRIESPRPGEERLPSLPLVGSHGERFEPWAEEMLYGCPYVFRDPRPERW